jgi:hypothetical protein
LFLFVCLLPLFGCGGVKMGEVSGNVKVKGVPLERGLVSFVGSVGEPVNIGVVNGTYGPVKVPVGEYKVTVRTIDAPGSNAGGQANPNVVGSGLGAGDGRPEGNKAKAWIDPSLADPNSSTLSTTIKIGPNTFDIPL